MLTRADANTKIEQILGTPPKLYGPFATEDRTFSIFGWELANITRAHWQRNRTRIFLISDGSFIEVEYTDDSEKSVDFFAFTSLQDLYALRVGDKPFEATFYWDYMGTSDAEARLNIIARMTVCRWPWIDLDHEVFAGQQALP